MKGVSNFQVYNNIINFDGMKMASVHNKRKTRSKGARLGWASLKSAKNSYITITRDMVRGRVILGNDVQVEAENTQSSLLVP